MIFTARPDALYIDKIGEVKIILTANERQLVQEGYDKLKEIKTLSVEIKPYRQKRSLDANAYMWVLLSKIAEVIHTSKDEVYLEMLQRYSTAFTHIIVHPSAVERTLESWRTARVIGNVIVKGKKGVQIQCYYGSSTFDTKEMATLIDGIVSECQALSIDTLPPEDIEKMKREWANEQTCENESN